MAEPDIVVGSTHCPAGVPIRACAATGFVTIAPV